MLHVRYHNTNCFFVRSSLSQQLLAMDAGWPGTLYEYARSMKTISCSLESIGWAMVTHFHMDHAGLIAEFLERGITCYAFERQVEAIDAMEKTILRNDKSYRRIDKSKLKLVRTEQSREVLERIGVRGQILPTGYHSPDSVMFISDDGEAVIGDLPPEGQMMPDDEPFQKAWGFLRRTGVRKIYPSHAGSFELTERPGG